MTNLETIRAKCIEANPESSLKSIGAHEDMLVFLAQLIDLRTGNGSQQDGDSEYMRQELAKDRPIRLADVLLAIEEAGLYCWYRKADAYTIEGSVARVIVEWNLRTDDLSQQSPETIDFIAQLVS